jgi:alpha-amylase/alpha-mannosidase (GH57 family)
MKELEQYKMATGYYDEGAIMQAAGESERSARFVDIFGDAQGTPDLGADHNALLAEARRRNAKMHAAREAANEQEARALVIQPEPWSRGTWKRLVELQYATRFVDDNDGDMSLSYSLTERGQKLLDPSYSAPGAYADQAGLDG